MPSIDKKKAYNHNLSRIWKAIEYLDSPERTEAERERFINDYKILLKNQEELMKVCGLKGGQAEVVEGFKI